jgi:hypothetical protein
MKKSVPYLKAKREEAKRKADKYIGRDGGAAPSPQEETKLGGLGEMSPIEYSRRRVGIAEELDTSLAFLDMEWKRRCKSAKAESDESEDVLPPDPEPWREPVIGAELLKELVASVGSYMSLPSGAAEICALWVLFTHVHDCFDISTYLAVTSPTPECGKTTLMTWLGVLVPKPLPASNITAAVTFRAVDKWSPTLLIDEADTFLHGNNEFRGILDSGHNRYNAWVIRADGDDYEPRRYSTWAPKAIALIGKLSPTLASRSIHIKLQRKLSTEKVIPLRADKLSHLIPLHRKAARWATDSEAQLRASDPDLPPELQSRNADNWRQLIAIADLVDGEWPKLVRSIAVKAVAADRNDTAAIMLLADLKAIFERRKADKLHSDEIVADLIAMEDRPWAEWKNGRPLTKEQLAKLMGAFEIAPKQFKIEGRNRRGYEHITLKSLFDRYLGATPLPLAETQGFAGDSRCYLEGDEVAPQEGKKSQNLKAGSTVASQKPKPGENEGMASSKSMPDADADADSLDAKMEFEERAAILEHDGCFSRQEAERRALGEVLARKVWEPWLRKAG